MPFPHQPMTLTRRAQPFSHPDWLFEIKYDGFRALAYLKRGQCQLVSRKGYVYKRFGELTEQIAASLNVQTVLDGEIVCLDKNGILLELSIGHTTPEMLLSLCHPEPELNPWRSKAGNVMPTG